MAQSPDKSVVSLQSTSEEPHSDEHEDIENHVYDGWFWGRMNKLHLFTQERPCLAFWLYLFAYLSMWIILLPLIATLGDNALTITTDVPMYMRSDTRKQQVDALAAAEREADWEWEADASVVPQSTVADVDLTVVFIAKKKSRGLIHAKTLEKMDSVIQRVLDASGYTEVCHRVYADSNNASSANKCARPVTIQYFYDPDYFLGALNESYTVHPSEFNFRSFFLPSLLPNSFADVVNMDYSDENLDEITAYWSGYARGQLPNDTLYGHGIYQEEKMPARFYFTYSPNNDGNLENSSLANLYGRLVDKFFSESPNEMRVRAALASFSFGYPLPGYESDNDKIDKQNDDIAEWIYDELHPYFMRGPHSNSFTLRWHCDGVSNYYLDDVLVADMSLLIVTILAVWLYTVFSVGSFFLGTIGMIMIFLNFAPALLLYRYITQFKYFGTLNMLSIFIILSIGADDIFVLIDSWEQTRTKWPKASVNKRLTHTLHHAAKVMLTTSLSTIFSFVGNATSAFPAVYTFGTFAAWLVFVNYMGVVLFYPNVLVIHEIYFYTPEYKRSWCLPRGCFRATEKGDLPTNVGCWKMTQAQKEKQAKRSANSDGSEDESIPRRPIDLFFENRVFVLVSTWKKTVLALFALWFILFFGFAMRLEPDPNPPQFFPDGNNYHEYNFALLDWFGSADSLRIKSSLVFGVKGIDRKGTDPTIPSDIGDPIWVENFNLLSAETQLFVAQLCDDMVCAYLGIDCRYGFENWNRLWVTGDENEYALNTQQCVMTEYRRWVYTSSLAHPNDTDIAEIIEKNNLNATVSDFDNCTYGVFPVQPQICQFLLFVNIWLEDEMTASNPNYQAGMTNLDYYSEFFGAEGEEGVTVRDILPRFTRVETKLDAFSTTDYRDGISLWNRWDNYIDKWRNNIDGTVSIDQFGNEFIGPPPGFEYIFFTDQSGIYSYYFVQEALTLESMTGIGLSLALAFGVLLVATMNWIISIMAITVISMIVVCIIGFSVMAGWKLGVMESIIYVMVVGMSVDYTVHCSEAYLASSAKTRLNRSKSMLGLVGASVLSGSLSTVLGVVWMLLATMPFFFKFGSSILYLEGVALCFALFGLTAATSAFGPENLQGDIPNDYRRLRAYFGYGDSESDNHSGNAGEDGPKTSETDGANESGVELTKPSSPMLGKGMGSKGFDDDEELDDDPVELGDNGGQSGPAAAAELQGKDDAFSSDHDGMMD